MYFCHYHHRFILLNRCVVLRVVSCLGQVRIEDAIRVAGLAKVRGERLLNMLQIIKSERREANFEYLLNIQSTDEIVNELSRFIGNGIFIYLGKFVDYHPTTTTMMMTMMTTSSSTQPSSSSTQTSSESSSAQTSRLAACQRSSTSSMSSASLLSLVQEPNRYAMSSDVLPAARCRNRSCGCSLVDVEQVAWCPASPMARWHQRRHPPGCGNGA